MTGTNTKLTAAVETYCADLGQVRIVAGLQSRSYDTSATNRVETAQIERGPPRVGRFFLLTP